MQTAQQTTSKQVGAKLVRTGEISNVVCHVRAGSIYQCLPWECLWGQYDDTSVALLVCITTFHHYADQGTRFSGSNVLHESGTSEHAMQTTPTHICFPNVFATLQASGTAVLTQVIVPGELSVPSALPECSGEVVFSLHTLRASSWAINESPIARPWIASSTPWPGLHRS